MKQARKTGARASSRGRLTLDDIASKVGVSTITVSRAFRTPNKVAPKVRARILKTAQQMGYVISRAASSLASARSMNIAVIVPSLSNTVFVDMLAGVEKVLRPKGYHLLLGVSNYSPEEEEALVLPECDLGASDHRRQPHGRRVLPGFRRQLPVRRKDDGLSQDR